MTGTEPTERDSDPMTPAPIVEPVLRQYVYQHPGHEPRPGEDLSMEFARHFDDFAEARLDGRKLAGFSGTLKVIITGADGKLLSTFDRESLKWTDLCTAPSGEPTR